MIVIAVAEAVDSFITTEPHLLGVSEAQAFPPSRRRVHKEPRSTVPLLDMRRTAYSFLVSIPVSRGCLEPNQTSPSRRCNHVQPMLHHSRRRPEAFRRRS